MLCILAEMEKRLVIFDRDGIINREIGQYVWRSDDWVWVDGFWEFVERLKAVNCVFAIATNQGGIAKGLYTVRDFHQIMSLVEDKFRVLGAQLTGIYFAPGHDDFGKTLFRKPHSLMLEKAMAVAGVSRENTIFIGDSLRDVQAAEKAGIRSYRVLPNSNLNELFHDYQF